MHPQLLHLSIPWLGRELPVTTYGTLLLAGVIVGILVGLWRAPCYALARSDVLHVGLLGVAGGLGGAMGLYIVIHLPEMIAEPSLLRSPGLVFYGGLVGGGLAAWWYCRNFAISLTAMADCGAPALALGHAIGRIGCLMGGCCYGRACDAHYPLAVELAGALRHPVQAYESALLLLLAIVLLALSRRLRARPGALFIVYAAGYAAVRIVTETFRGDAAERGVWGSISTSQLIAALFLVAVGLWCWRRR